VSPKCELDALFGVQKQLDKLLQNYELKMSQHCKGLLKKQYAYFPYFTNDFGEIWYIRSQVMLLGNSEFREYRGSNSYKLLSGVNKRFFFLFYRFFVQIRGKKSEKQFL